MWDNRVCAAGLTVTGKQGMVPSAVTACRRWQAPAPARADAWLNMCANVTATVEANNASVVCSRAKIPPPSILRTQLQAHCTTLTRNTQQQVCAMQAANAARLGRETEHVVRPGSTHLWGCLRTRMSCKAANMRLVPCRWHAA